MGKKARGFKPSKWKWQPQRFAPRFNYLGAALAFWRSRQVWIIPLLKAQSVLSRSHQVSHTLHLF
jgi:hypothetical protein